MKCLTPEIYVVNEAMIMFMAMIMLPTGNGGLQRRSKCSRCDPSCPSQGIQPFFCDHLLQHRHPYHFLLFSSLIWSSLISSLLRHHVKYQCKNIIVSAPESLRGQKELPYLTDLWHVWGRTPWDRLSFSFFICARTLWNRESETKTITPS